MSLRCIQVSAAAALVTFTFFWVSARPRIRCIHLALRVGELFASSDLPDREATLSPFLGLRVKRALLVALKSSR